VGHGLVKEPGAWSWSSYLAMIGAQPVPPWLATDSLLAAFGTRRADAVRRYMRFVADGVGAEPIWEHLKSQVFLGDEAFVTQSLKRIEANEDINIPRAQRRPPPPSLEDIKRQCGERNVAMVAAHATGGYSYQRIGAHFGVHFTTVAKVVRRAKTGR
jgi:putative transposase